MKKKLFTIALALCMVFTMIPGGVFQVETAWAESGDTPTSVEVAGVEMVDNAAAKTFYKIGDTAATTQETTDYDAMYTKATNTLTLKGFTYNGSEMGVYANGNLKIVVDGENNITSNGSYGIWTTGDLTILGTDKDADILTVKSSGQNAIFAFENDTGKFFNYAESINISHVSINALADESGDVGICAPYKVTIADSHVVSTGETHGIQGGYFATSDVYGPGNRGEIKITDSVIKAVATSESQGAKALKEKVTVDGKTYNHNNAKIVNIPDVHEHCICGATHKNVGTHGTTDKQTFTEWSSSSDLPSTAGYYYLTNNVSISASWQPAKDTVLCLNGKTITANGDFDAVTVDDEVTFTLTNCSTAGKITHTAEKNGRGVTIKPSGNFIMYDGTIDGNSYNYNDKFYNPDNSQNSYGGGVCNDGTFTMNGGVISKNKVFNATQNFGAGVFNYNGRSFNMNAGTICNNEAGTDGDNHRNKGGGIYNAGIFTMKNGSVRDNTAKEGAGVLTQILDDTKEATFKMEGGTITGNVAKGSAPYGGGVMVRKNGVLSVSGNAIINNNFTDVSGDQTANDVYLYSQNTIAVGTMESEAKIGVSSDQAASIKAGGEDVQVSTAATSASYVTNDIFFSDDEELELYCAGDSTGVLKLRKATVKVYTITWDANGGTFDGAATTKEDKIKSGESITAPATNPTKENYVFAGWYDAANGGNKIQSFGNAAGNITYYAHWTEKTTPSGGGSGSGGGSSTSRTDVITTGTTDSKVTSSPSQVKNETTTDANGNSVTTATVTVSAANQREILSQAKANKSGEIIIKVSRYDVKNGAKIALSLEKSFIESIVNDTDAKLTIQTPSGEKTFTQEELKKLAAEATGNTVTIDPTSAGTTEPTVPTEPTNPSADKNAKLVKGVGNTTIVLKSKLTKDGKVLLTWTKSKGYKVDKFEFYRSVKRYSGYGTKAFFTTKDGDWSKYLNTKNLKAGKTYYYKVRGVRTIDGQKYYTQWSNKAWRTVK